ncbi:hypothetical protein ACFV6Z_34610 [Streptomyces sp. NPDC059818]|uniref:hypothetical protein n=1 Tax=Streptomyces sp. NPDC059818 TaxID=3346962 RepID=UPI00364DB7C2
MSEDEAWAPSLIAADLVTDMLRGLRAPSLTPAVSSRGSAGSSCSTNTGWPNGSPPSKTPNIVSFSATWHQMRRLWTKAEKGPLERSHTKQEVTQVGVFLAWLAGRGHSIGQCQQAERRLAHQEPGKSRGA